MKNKVKYLNGSVQAVFYGLQFRSNRLKHSVKRFGRFGLATLVRAQLKNSIRLHLALEFYQSISEQERSFLFFQYCLFCEIDIWARH